MLPWLLLVVDVPYELSLAMFSFLNMSTLCRLPCYAIKCFVVSAMSLYIFYH